MLDATERERILAGCEKMTRALRDMTLTVQEFVDSAKVLGDAAVVLELTEVKETRFEDLAVGHTFWAGDGLSMLGEESVQYVKTDSNGAEALSNGEKMYHILPGFTVDVTGEDKVIPD